MSSEPLVRDAIEDIVEQIGFGKQQLLVLVGGGCAHATNTAMAISTSQAARAIVAEKNYSKLYTGLLTSVLFVGYILGNVLSDHLEKQEEKHEQSPSSWPSSSWIWILGYKRGRKPHRPAGQFPTKKRSSHVTKTVRASTAS